MDNNTPPNNPPIDNPAIVEDPFRDRDAEIYENLSRVGEQTDLTSIDPALKRLGVGVGWNLIGFQANEIDVDVSAFLLDHNSMTQQDEDFIFYNNARACDGAVIHNGDNRTGAGDGDDETISMNLTGIPFTVTRIALAVTIYKSYEKEVNLGSVRNLYIRLFNEETEAELTRFLLSKELDESENGGVIVGYIDREGANWIFRPSLEFFHKGLGEIATKFGMIIGQE